MRVSPQMMWGAVLFAAVIAVVCWRRGNRALAGAAVVAAFAAIAEASEGASGGADRLTATEIANVQNAMDAAGHAQLRGTPEDVITTTISLADILGDSTAATDASREYHQALADLSRFPPVVARFQTLQAGYATWSAALSAERKKALDDTGNNDDDPTEEEEVPRVNAYLRVQGVQDPLIEEAYVRTSGGNYDVEAFEIVALRQNGFPAPANYTTFNGLKNAANARVTAALERVRQVGRATTGTATDRLADSVTYTPVHRKKRGFLARMFD
jgi:hypothetical protein